MSELMEATTGVTEIPYIGQELDVFALARNWKGYWRSQIEPFLGTDVLEVGAGDGNNTEHLLEVPDIHLTSLEPDSLLTARHRQRLFHGPKDHRDRVTLVEGVLSDMAPDRLFDSILYIDVLEHIERHVEEARVAMSHLRPGGRLIVLSPAAMCLFTEFDTALGHFRRYSLRTLAETVPASMRQRRLVYLDSVGFFLSLGNKMFLKQSLPTADQIRLWDGPVMSLSKWVDPVLKGCFGRSVLGVWSKD